jgi:hypothetical protein
LKHGYVTLKYYNVKSLTHACIHTTGDIYLCVCTYYIYIYIYTGTVHQLLVCTYIYIYIHTHTHTHTYIQVQCINYWHVHKNVSISRKYFLKEMTSRMM